MGLGRKAADQFANARFKYKILARQDGIRRFLAPPLRGIRVHPGQGVDREIGPDYIAVFEAGFALEAGQQKGGPAPASGEDAEQPAAGGLFADHGHLQADPGAPDAFRGVATWEGSDLNLQIGMGD